MRIAKTISITLPPDLLLKAQQTALREHRTMSELLREALRRYMGEDRAQQLESWNRLLQRTQAQGRALGINNQDDVDRMIHEYRAEKRK